MNWTTWFFWIAVNAADPLLAAIGATAAVKEVSQAAPNRELISWTLGGLAVASVAAPALLKWAVLRRMAPELRLWVWLASVLIAAAVSAVLLWKGVETGAREFLIAGIKVRTEPTLRDFLGLPWGHLLTWTAVVTGLVVLAPSWVFARAAGLRWYVPLLAAVVGACAAAVADQMYYLVGFHVHPTDMGLAMNGWSWTDRMRELCVRGGTGALAGASSGLVVALFICGGEDSESSRPRLPIQSWRGLGAMLATILAIATAAPAVGFVLDPFGRRASLDRLSRTFSFAPSQDVSEGEGILRYSHTAEAETGQYAAAMFSPDGKTFMTLTGDRKLARISTESGKTLGTVGEPLRRHEPHALAWSLDGRFLALRTYGEEVRIPNTPYTRHRARFRLYSLPDYEVVGEYSHGEDECFDSYANPSMMFESDGKSLWVLCAQYAYPDPKSLMAIRLDVPSMKPVHLHRYREGATGEAVRGLARAGHSVWYWQHSSVKSDDLRVGDLTHDRVVTHVRDLKQPAFAGNFIWQDGKVTESRVTLRYRDGSALGQTTRWLVFDIKSGDLLEKRDETAQPLDFVRSVLEASDNLRIETLTRADSKAGEINVVDAVSGKRRQRIHSLAQRPAGISPDGRWLVTHAFQQGTLRVYTITP